MKPITIPSILLFTLILFSCVTQSEIAYQNAAKVSTIEAYKDVIEMFPRSKQASWSKRAIKDIEDEINEKNRWLKANEINTLYSYYTYRGKYKDEANKKFDSLFLKTGSLSQEEILKVIKQAEYIARPISLNELAFDLKNYDLSKPIVRQGNLNNQPHDWKMIIDGAKIILYRFHKLTGNNSSLLCLKDDFGYSAFYTLSSSSISFEDISSIFKGIIPNKSIIPLLTLDYKFGENTRWIKFYSSDGEINGIYYNVENKWVEVLKIN